MGLVKETTITFKVHNFWDYEKDNSLQSFGIAGAPAGTRTPTLLIRSLMYRIIHDTLG